MTERYRCVLADPPWAYADQMLNMRSTGDGCAAKYRTMSIKAIQEFFFLGNQLEDDGQMFPISHLVARDAHLWLWATNAFLEEGFRVARAWGFTPKTIATWVKGRLMGDGLVHHIGQGHYLRNSTEHVILAVRGRCPALVKNLPTAFVHPGRWPGRLHSEKPPTIHEWAEQLSPGPRLELFARRRRPGWAAVGDEL